MMMMRARHPPHPPQDGCIALHVAAYYGHATVVAALFAAGADTQARNVSGILCEGGVNAGRAVGGRGWRRHPLPPLARS